MIEEERWIADEFIETIDMWALGSLRWPVMRVLSRPFVEKLELRRYERGLLATGRWTLVRVSPQLSDAGVASTHVFDVYGSRPPQLGKQSRDTEAAHARWPHEKHSPTPCYPGARR
ncbi:MAG TPA: hypothetical protein VKV73_21855 [Chloroflexota bacterium]|nr:hypothetical protein [Chloroflexota bacterium]